MGCDQPGLSSAPFEVTVELRGTRLIEVAGDGELHSYRPMAEVTSVSDAAEASFRAALADFDAGNCVRFYSQNFLRGSIDMRAASALCQSTESLRRGLPQITSTDFIHRSALDAVLTNGRYQQVDDVILLDSARTATEQLFRGGPYCTGTMVVGSSEGCSRLTKMMSSVRDGAHGSAKSTTLPVR